VYTAVHGVYGPGTRPYITRRRPCARPRTVHTVVFTACVHGRLRPCTDLVHGHARTVHIAVNSRVHGQRPLYTVCTRGTRPRTAVYTFRKHAREHGTRPCRQALNTTVFTVRTWYTAMYGRVHNRVRVMDGPYTWPVHHVPAHGRPLYTGRKDGRVQGTRPYMVHDRI